MISSGKVFSNWLWVTGHWSLVISLGEAGHWSLVIGLGEAGHWSLVIDMTNDE
jgi:hypothetical protein